MIFDEVFSSWFSSKELLPNSDSFKAVLDSYLIQLSQDEDEGESNEENIDEDVIQNPWQAAIYQQLRKRGEIIGAHLPRSLRRLRIRQQSSKFTIASIIEDKN